MAIVKMNKISVVGLTAARDSLMEELMKMGVVEFNAQETKLADDAWSELVTKDGNEIEATKIDSLILSVSMALETISRYETGKSPLFKTRTRVSPEAFRKILSERDAIIHHVEQVLLLSHEISELKTEENSIRANQLSVEPWLSYTVPFSLQGTKYTSVIMGTVPNAVDMNHLKQAIDEKTEAYETHFVSSDIEQHYISIICLKQDHNKVIEVLNRYGFTRMTFKDLTGTPVESMAMFEEQLNELQETRDHLETKIREAFRWKTAMEYLYDDLVMKRDKELIRSKLLKTDQTFYMDGWLPEKSVSNVEKLLIAKGCYFEITEPDVDEDTPILLRNGKLAAPFRAITNLYGMPSVNAIDPTPFLAPFYCLFFGIMMGDAGYGIIISTACFMLLKKYDLEGMTRWMIQMFFFCGLSTIFWGAIFGGWFGNLIPSVASVFFGLDVTLAPIWFDPVMEPMTLLFFSFILGAIHIMVGLGLKAYILIKNGRTIDAICDIGFWYLVFAGIALLILPGMAEAGKWFAVAGVAGLLLTGGRAKKSIFGKITGGFSALYGIVQYFSDVLSYSRLLALGLASAVIAQVINTMGTLAGAGVVGAILMVAVGIVGHSFNLAINILGCFVHSCRLQYVEFFGKFFGKEGDAFEPFDRKTKYVFIQEEDN